jgi:hypothetical protein
MASIITMEKQFESDNASCFKINAQKLFEYTYVYGKINPCHVAIVHSMYEQLVPYLHVKDDITVNVPYMVATVLKDRYGVEYPEILNQYKPEYRTVYNSRVDNILSAIHRADVVAGNSSNSMVHHHICQHELGRSVVCV